MATTKAVNRPTDPALRDRDIERKLQIYGMVTAFGNGKVPTNQQIDVAMNSALAWKPLANPPNTLSRDGQVLCQDLREVIQRAKELVLSKNSGNLFQDFTWQTRHIGQGDAGSLNAPVSKDTANQHANEAAENLRTLGRLLITNGQFRKLLNDATILLRDVAGDAAQKTANKVNPSEEQLSQIDQAEQDHTWHDTPDFSRENLKQQAQARAPVSKETLKQAAGDATQSADPQGARNPDDAAQRAQQARDTSGMDPKSGAKSGFDTISRNVDENQKQRLREQRERAANYVDTKFPKERREQVIYRLKKMVVECQEHREYQQAIDGLLRLAEEYQGHAKNAGQQGVSNVQGGRNQSSVGNAEYDLKTLLERFANGTSFDDVIEAVNQIYRDADNDRELRDWFKSLDTYIRKILKTEGYILDDKATQEYNQIHEKGDYLLRQKYKQHFDRVIDEVKYVGQQFDADPQNKALAESLEKLFHDLGKDASGNQAFKPHLLKDLNDVILPNLFKEIGYIPVPRIEYSDPMIDAVVENLILEGDNMAPNVLEFGSDNYFKWTRGVARDQNRNKNNAMIGVSGIQMDMRDIAYYIKKKQGFPAVTDKGVMDIFFGGSGISFKVALETADKSDQQHFFKIKQVTIDIQNMDIKLKQSNHKLLFNLFKPLLLKVVKPVVQKVLEKQIRDQVTYWDGVAYEAKKEGDSLKAQADRNPDPNNQKSIYQYYYQAFQNQLQREKAKKPAPPPPEQKGQTNVAITQNDSILKNVQLPGGFSTKATKYNDMAKQGDKWESPIFSLGSASESRNIQATNVTRRGGKPTNTSSTVGAGAAGAGVAGAGAGATTFSSDATNRAGQLDPGRATELSREAPIAQPATIGSGTGSNFPGNQ